MTDRVDERGVLDNLIGAVKSGESRTLVMRGDPGIGKTVLLEYLARRAASEGCLVATAVGVESEMELAFAGLHQLCGPLLSHADRLPVPQREALQTVLGARAGPPPDRFFVGLAVLSLLSTAARERPLLCVIDDEQWLDIASAQTLGFVARRLWAEPIGLVFAARAPGPELAGLPELHLHGLKPHDARVLLTSRLAGTLDDRIADLIVAETRGNPLALIELPRGLSPGELAGGFGLPAAGRLTARIEESFARQLRALPAPTVQLMQLAAADSSGDLSLVRRAAAQLGIGPEVAAPAVKAGLVEFGAQVRFRHPLARSAAYKSAPISDRQRLHAALADVTNPDTDPERRAWHRAQASAESDEGVAVELERAAIRARARGGLAAAAAFLEWAVALTSDAAHRAERILSAAQISVQAGALDKAKALLGMAEAAPLDEFQRAQLVLLQANIAFATGQLGDAPQLLLNAARGLEQFDLELARETYLYAWTAAGMAGPVGGRETFLEVCHAIQALPPRVGAERPVDMLLDGLALLGIGGYPAGAASLIRAAKALTSMPVEEVLRWGLVGTAAACAVLDIESMQTIIARQVQLVREAGALSQLPLFLSQQTMADVWRGDLAAAAAACAETDSIAAATGISTPPYSLTRFLAARGREAEAKAAVSAALEDASAGAGIAAFYGHWAAAVLYNGLGRYEPAAEAAREATTNNILAWELLWVLPELVEAATRTGKIEIASRALAQLDEITKCCGTDAALGIGARCRALLADEKSADGPYREAIERLGRSHLNSELARAHLLYGEWLRRKGRRIEAREQLQTAHSQLTAMGMEAFAERAARELSATGATARKRTPETRNDLTPSELQIALLARGGLSNGEIGARLFLSARTVEWHLRKVYVKLGITRRAELGAALSDQHR